MNGMAADDYPEIPTIDEKKAAVFKLSVEEFKESLGQVIIAASTDTTRPALTGVYFNTFNEDIYVAATDGYRLADKKLVSGVKDEIKAIVPVSALREVLSSISDDMEDVEVSVEED